MSNRRARTRRKENKILETISNKTFIRLSIISIIIIVVCIIIMQFLNAKEKQKIAEEKARIDAQIEDIYTSTSAKINSANEKEYSATHTKVIR